MSEHLFNFSDEQFADIQMLRYRLENFDSLPLRQKKFIFCLSQATLFGRDITFDQFGKYNLQIRRILEAIHEHYKGNRNSDDFRALEVYLKRVWFSNGIYHHYGYDKLEPGFSKEFFREALYKLENTSHLQLREGLSLESLIKEIIPVIFDPNILPKRVNKKDGDDLITTSACNYYEGVTQAEVEDFYNSKKNNCDKQHPVSHGLNSTLAKKDREIKEIIWKIGGRYSKAIEKIVHWLNEAGKYVENKRQEEIINLLVEYYRTGDLATFDKYSIAWLNEKEGLVDFINGFIEVYSDPIGLKASWEGIVQYKDTKATERTQLISQNAQWFEDHSPINPQFRKPIVKGITASVVCAAMLGGDEYPSSAIGINLPNSNWIRAEYGSKSVTISNLTHAYNMAAKGNGLKEEFVINKETINIINQYSDKTDALHTDLHECLGHGSGRLMPGIDPDALKNYGNTIEEARADLFGLYYIADPKLLELGLLDNPEAYKAQYYCYMMNGLLTQLARIEQGKQIEESHMQNRALITRWALELGQLKNVAEMIRLNGKTYLQINNYEELRNIFAYELSEIQRIKSQGDFYAARSLVEKYAIKIDPELHQEIITRYTKLNIAPYKGFINPILCPIYNKEGDIIDICPDYTESYSEQMMRYSKEYATL